MEPSAERSFLNQTASISLRASSSTTQEASRSMSFPGFLRPNRPFSAIASQPRPRRTFVSSPPPCFSSEIRWPLDKLTDIGGSSRLALHHAHELERRARDLLGGVDVLAVRDA